MLSSLNVINRNSNRINKYKAFLFFSVVSRLDYKCRAKRRRATCYIVASSSLDFFLLLILSFCGSRVICDQELKCDILQHNLFE
jgi:hypothetical protein